ncbi:MAG: tetraacyldisaccharide 4'-kinase, partial [Desulfobacterales bacterium]
GGDIGVESGFPEPFASDSDFLKGHTAVCFSGIARNDDFMHTVKNIGCQVTRFFTFPDHHRYSDRDINEIIDAAKQTKSKFILTTEKDFVRIQQKIVWPSDFVVIDVKIFFGPDEKPFNRFIKSRIEGFKKRTMIKGTFGKYQFFCK